MVSAESAPFNAPGGWRAARRAQDWPQAFPPGPGFGRLLRSSRGMRRNKRDASYASARPTRPAHAFERHGLVPPYRRVRHHARGHSRRRAQLTPPTTTPVLATSTRPGAPVSTLKVCAHYITGDRDAQMASRRPARNGTARALQELRVGWLVLKTGLKHSLGTPRLACTSIDWAHRQKKTGLYRTEHAHGNPPSGAPHHVRGGR